MSKPDAQLIIAGVFVAGGAVSVMCGKNLIAVLLTLLGVIAVVTRPEILRLQKERAPMQQQQQQQQQRQQGRAAPMRIVSTEGQQFETSSAPAEVHAPLARSSSSNAWTLQGVSTPADNEAVKARIRAEGLYGVLGRTDAAAMSRHAHQTFGFVEPLQARKDFLAYSLADMPHMRDEFMRPV